MRARQRLDGPAGHIVCDSRHLPIVVLRWVGQIDLTLVAAFDRWLDALLDMLEREQLRAAMVVDVSGSEAPDAEARRALVSLRTSKAPRTRARLAVELVVINRPALRAAITAMHWIAPHVQVNPVATLDEGLQRCQDVLAREGIVAPRLTAFDFEGC